MRPPTAVPIRAVLVCMKVLLGFGIVAGASPARAPFAKTMPSTEPAPLLELAVLPLSITAGAAEVRGEAA
jgi:hypothetical protein